MSLPDINTFKSGLFYGGARANYYIVEGKLPDLQAERNLSFLCRSASLPVANVNVVEVMTPGGRKLKLSGERTFDNWTITVYNDTAMKMRKAFEIWQTKSGLYSSPIAFDSLDSYASSAGWKVWQLSRSGQAVHGYSFYNCWPARLGEISLSYDEAGSIEEFEVELAFSHYIPTGEYSANQLPPEASTIGAIFGTVGQVGGISAVVPEIVGQLSAFTTGGGGGGGLLDAETGF